MEIAVSEHEFSQAMATGYYAMTPGQANPFNGLSKEGKACYYSGFRAFLEVLGVKIIP